MQTAFHRQQKCHQQQQNWLCMHRIGRHTRQQKKNVFGMWNPEAGLLLTLSIILSAWDWVLPLLLFIIRYDSWILLFWFLFDLAIFVMLRCMRALHFGGAAGAGSDSSWARICLILEVHFTENDCSGTPAKNVYLSEHCRRLRKTDRKWEFGFRFKAQNT